jgi:hypothetical protein
MKLSRAFLSIAAVSAATLIPTATKAVTIEVNASSHAQTPVPASLSSWWNSDHSATWQNNPFNANLTLGLQTLLNKPDIQNLIRNVGSHVQDPGLANLFSELENANFQLNPMITADLGTWLQNHHRSFDPNPVASFATSMEEANANSGSNSSKPENLPQPNGFQIPEPGTMSLLLAGAVGLIGLARRSARS